MKRGIGKKDDVVARAREPLLVNVLRALDLTAIVKGRSLGPLNTFFMPCLQHAWNHLYGIFDRKQARVAGLMRRCMACYAGVLPKSTLKHLFDLN
jgi:hypothetical protein